jgi:eukaryotic-like serine/threonine-protein kinase
VQPEPGTLLRERYRIGDLLGQGGMGLVYGARDLGSGAEVAIKFLRPELCERTRTVSRFQREARALARLASPHVVRVTDVATLADGTPFFVMERLIGRSLALELAARGRLPAAEAVSYLVQAARGAQAAHDQGIVHRDLKPENLFLCEAAGGRLLKVLDFGISKLEVAAGFRVTETDTSLGTPAYMSPEQLRSAKHVDARSDVWSLGVIGFQLLAGRIPFEGKNSAELARSVVRDDPPSLAELVPDLPAPLAAAIQRALRRDPALRPQSAAQFAVALEPFAAKGSLAAEPAALERSPSAFSNVPLPGDTHRDTLAPGRRAARPRADAAALLRVAAIGVGAGSAVSALLYFLRRAGVF